MTMAELSDDCNQTNTSLPGHFNVFRRAAVGGTQTGLSSGRFPLRWPV